jgi:hypothetical protein
MHRIIFPVLLLSVVFAASTARSQPPIYYGPLMYGLVFDTAVPPINIGMPSGIITSYLYFDEAMRLNSTGQVLSYINGMTWNDTAKWIASNFYQLHDYDPSAFTNWSGYWARAGDPYQCEPGTARNAFISKIQSLLGSRTYALFYPDVISDVTVSDTVCTKVPLGQAISVPDTTDMVLVHATILDEIKGQNIPSCTPYLKAGKKGPMPLGLATASPIWTYSTQADTGTCLQFAYSPEWSIVPLSDVGGPQLGWLVAPGQEYIVFLNFIGIGLDSTSGYFTVLPSGTFGHSLGIYPVVGGYVQDPHDDFGFGSTHLTVAEWKADLRARINSIIDP